ncbi:unnamed protein product, partial [Ectocarpus sp. 8 AP-2014]
MDRANRSTRPHVPLLLLACRTCYVPRLLSPTRRESPTMPNTEAYQPGLLSSLLLGTGSQAAIPGAKDTQARVEDAAAVSGTAEPTSKKKKKSKKRSQSTAGKDASSSPAADSGFDWGESAGDAGALPPAAGAGVVAGLASLFSPTNLEKFKRRERADKEADAAEVARITKEARARERREEEEAANSGKKKNKKAKKREEEEQENRRKLEAEKRLQIAAKRTAALAAAAEAVRAGGSTKKVNQSASEELEEDEEEEKG